MTQRDLIVLCHFEKKGWTAKLSSLCFYYGRCELAAEAATKAAAEAAATLLTLLTTLLLDLVIFLLLIIGQE